MSAAAPTTGVDLLTGAGLDEALAGAETVVNLVGVDQVPELDYYRAKVLQEDLLRAGPLPYSVVLATQFMEFVDAVLSWTADGDTVRLPRTPLQPIAAADVAAAVAEVAAGAPLNGIRNEDRVGPAAGCGGPHGRTGLYQTLDTSIAHFLNHIVN